ncbi:mutator type transposase [Tanacetum coccineum]
MCELLNRQLLDGRDKPIITCLEYIREYLMKKIVDVQKVIAKCDGPLTQNVTKLFNVIKEKAAQYKVEWNGDDKYQVIRPKGYQCVVNMSTKVCTCRRWELTRIPCKHAAAAINDMGNNGMGNNGMYYVPIELIPPKHHPQVGRPPKKRNKSAMEVEEMEKHGKLTRARKTVRCLLCKQIGHNRRSCKGQTIETKTNPGNKKRKIASQGKSSSQPPPISSPVRPSQGIVIRDSPSANTRSSRLQVSSQPVAAKKARKGKLNAKEKAK